MQRKHALALLTTAGLAAALLGAAPADGGTTTVSGGASERSAQLVLPGGFKRMVVIYEENHSFDNLYGGWGRVAGQHLVGRNDAPRARETQVAQDGTAYDCQLQNDVNLTSPTPLPTSCEDPSHGVPSSAFTNRAFLIDDYI